MKGMTKWVRDDGGDVNNADGLAYAKFIDTFAKALHAADKELSLDFFTDLPICAASRSSFPGRRSRATRRTTYFSTSATARAAAAARASPSTTTARPPTSRASSGSAAAP